MHFNEGQEQVINSIEGPIAVIACPGSGQDMLNRYRSK